MGSLSIVRWSVVWLPCYSWFSSLQWRHNERDGASNHRRLDCLLNRLFRRRSKKTAKLCVIGFREGYPPVTGGFPSQRASNMKNASIWWRHYVVFRMGRTMNVKRCFWYFSCVDLFIVIWKFFVWFMWSMYTNPSCFYWNRCKLMV